MLGVSADPVKKQNAFKAKHDLTIPLASDETHEMLEAYGVWAREIHVRPQLHGHRAHHLLIGPDGRIARIWPKVKVEGHAEEVLEAARAL